MSGKRLFLTSLALIAVSITGLQAGEPGWTHGVVKTGESREAIKSLPMTERPYRPLHVYGNTVRRLHYRGTVVPSARDLVQAGAVTVLRK